MSVNLFTWMQIFCFEMKIRLNKEFSNLLFHSCLIERDFELLEIVILTQNKSI